jgi:hypothetical protein
MSQYVPARLNLSQYVPTLCPSCPDLSLRLAVRQDVRQIVRHCQVLPSVSNQTCGQHSDNRKRQQLQINDEKELEPHTFRKCYCMLELLDNGK